MRSKARLMSRWTSSGSRRSDSEVKPETSTKSTVTCLRSPLSALAVVRILSARCFGVYASGEAKRGCAGLSSDTAHCPQNLFSGGLPAPHDGQIAISGAAHWPQNRAPEGFSIWHWGHFITPPRERAGQGRVDGSPSMVTASTSAHLCFGGVSVTT